MRLTQDSESKDFYILETLPAIKIRDLSAAMDRVAAQSYLSTLLRLQQTGSVNQEDNVREILGPYYDSSFQYTLRYVDGKDLSDAGPAPVGEGSFGKVYKCFWQEKPSRRGDIGATEPGFVALKVAIARDLEDQKSNAKFVKEVSFCQLLDRLLT